MSSNKPFKEYTYFNVTHKYGGSIEDIRVRTMYVLNPARSPHGSTLQEIVGNAAFNALLNSDRGDNTAKMLRGLIKEFGYEKVRYVFVFSIQFEESAEGGGFVIQD